MPRGLAIARSRRSHCRIGMRSRSLRAAPIAALITLVAAPLIATRPAEARYRVGLGEQSPSMFSSAAWRSLRLKQVRYIVSWDWARTGQQAAVDAFMNAARAHRQGVLVT